MYFSLTIVKLSLPPEKIQQTESKLHQDLFHGHLGQRQRVGQSFTDAVST